MSVPNIPAHLYQSLILKLVAVLELTQSPDGVVTPQAKQALLQAVRFVVFTRCNNGVDRAQTNDYKNAMSQARELASNLPGGELVIEEQEQVIQMLEQLRDRKKCRSSVFSVFPYLCFL